MKHQLLVADALAGALLAGTPDVDGFVVRGTECLGRRHRWLPGLARRVFQRFGTSLAAPDRAMLVAIIAADRSFLDAWNRVRPPRVRKYFLEPPRMSPRRGGLAACPIPALATPGELATWLGIAPTELDWFADVGQRNPVDGPLAHYSYSWIPKRSGLRMLEVPKSRLRALQRRVLRGILEAVPLHQAVHGFRRGRSCLTYAQPHIGQDVVLRLDLRDFFPAIPAHRVHALFETLGYPEAVARLLTGLCTNRVPMRVARSGAANWMAAKRLSIPHLPQGAPTSPALANLCALHLDLRLDAFATSLGASYTRYADDLAFSGGEALRRRSDTVSRWVVAIAAEEGFALNVRKSRTMHRSHRQVLTGIVVNARPNVPREDYDRLKAILHNCARHGPATQNRDAVPNFRAHLAGRIAHVRSLNPERAERLEAAFARIAWS